MSSTHKDGPVLFERESLVGMLLGLLQDSHPPPKVNTAEINSYTQGVNSLRKYYNETGVLVVRPRSDGLPKGLAATFKLGGNDGGHFHNDIGSYTISVDGIKLSGDPGGPLSYEARTFNSQTRFSSFVTNSQGHPVPVIDGKLQMQADKVMKSANRPRILSTSFTDSVDIIVYDLAPAYESQSLVKLTRKIQYDRGNQKILITDQAEFSSPSRFESALIANFNWESKNTSSNEIYGRFWNDGSALQAKIFSKSTITIQEKQMTDYGIKIKRIGISSKDSGNFRHSLSLIRWNTNRKTSSKS
jgi:hypothetical protein